MYNKLINFVLGLQAVTFPFCSDQSITGFVCVFLCMFIEKLDSM